MIPVRFLSPLLAIALALGASGVADAHGGRRVLRTTAGPYRIEASVARAGDLIDETVAVEDAATDRPVAGATVALTLESESGATAGPFLAASAEGGYEARYPPPGDGRWTVVIDVRGPLGEATARHPYRPPPGGLWSGRAALAVNALVIVALVAAVFLLPRLGRRRGDAARREAGAPGA